MLLINSSLRALYKSLLSGFLVTFISFAQAESLGFVESLQDNSPGLSNLQCTHAVVTSPDDKFSYSSSYCDDALNIFARDPFSGKLTIIASLVGNKITGEGLRSAKWLAMHPTGKYLFASGITGIPANNTYHHTIYVYERDAATGLLAFKSELNNPLINNAWNMHISADGNFLYVGRQNGIEVIKITNNGLLGHVQSMHKTSMLSKYSYTRSFVFSPDNKYVYVDSGNNSISWLLRDSASGHLSFGGELLSPGMVAATGSLRIRSLGISKDGKHLYAFLKPNDINETVLRHFTIANNGSLTFADDILTTRAATKFYCPSEILVSANDKFVYFIDGCADNFQVWLRNTATGTLNYAGSESEHLDPNNIPDFAFSQINNIGFSNDGNFVIAAVNAGITTLNLAAYANLK